MPLMRVLGQEMPVAPAAGGFRIGEPGIRLVLMVTGDAAIPNVSTKLLGGMQNTKPI